MIGREVSEYRIESELGRGGYGVVYRAVNVHNPGLRAAVKVVRGGLGEDRDFVGALERECVRLDGLDHPGIVRFRHLTKVDGHPAMVLELLEGSDLHVRLSSKGALAVPEVVRILDSVLDGLAYAHAKGLHFLSRSGRLARMRRGCARPRRRGALPCDRRTCGQISFYVFLIVFVISRS